ncbi:MULTISPECIES: AlbA family DNA-binding domain-containing protein [Aerococcus]|uniref:AlbA family DNA-binding domain-containing protein n=1 Tax=Aerococcus TaxID=1375 RepID=UPI000200ED68|nr:MULTISPECIES: RNA-binding domain-containing protein [Aerococcus]AEA01691.1 divergent AAA domain protein [Aerococcus sp. Group 1]MCY3055114.1 ATP-binding protein [Aerococcus sp. Group 1]MCY3056844.1 ATP-binding protein [Aerococcus sp. Group 1]MCY3062296.1 ATP-binding protein [Aerococcus sp. Group 1]
MEISKFYDLVSNGENDRVDYKKKWYTKDKKIDLVIDILNFVNTVHHEDCYIIIGIEDESKEIVGIDTNDENRLQAEDVTDHLRNLSLSGNYIPEIEVSSIEIEDKICDIITIYNTDHTPIYLMKDYRNGRRIIGAGQILSRNQGSNTPIDRTAPDYILEKLWRKRFHLDKDIKDRYNSVLKDYNNWTFVDSFNGNPARFIYNLDPNFYIDLIDDMSGRDQFQPISLNAVRLKITWKLARLKYNHLEIESKLIYWMDDARFLQVCPYTGFVSGAQESFSYEYFIADSIAFNLNELLWKCPSSLNHHYLYEQKNRIMKSVVIYSSLEEKRIVESDVSAQFNLQKNIEATEEEIKTVEERIDIDINNANNEYNWAKNYIEQNKLGRLINSYMEENDDSKK